MSESKILDEKIMVWGIKEIYKSPYVINLYKLTGTDICRKYLAAKKNLKEKNNSEIVDLIKYFIKCLQNQLEELN